MTQREFLQTIVTSVENTELVEHAKKELKKLDEKNEKRRNSESKKSKENAPIKKSIVEFLTGKELTLCSEIAEGVGISTQKASALCKQLVEDNILFISDAKVKNKGTLKAYKVSNVVVE